MAYVDQPGQTEQDKLNQQSPLNQPPTTGTAIGTAAAGDKTPNQPSSSVAPAPFTNLGSYLQVNAPQIQGMAEKVSGQLGQTYDTAKGAVDTGSQAIQNQIAAGYAAPNPELVEQAAANPTEFASTPENVAAFQAQYGNQYTGPASAEVTPDYTTTQGAVQKAVNDAANLGNYGGLQSYLTTNLETNPTQAMSALDTALLNQSPEAISQINAQAARFPGLTDYLNQAMTQQNQNIAGAQTAAQTAAQAAQNKFVGEGGVIPTFSTDLNKRLEAARALALTQGNAAVNALGDFSKFNPDVMNILGINPEEANRFVAGKGILDKYGNTIDPATGNPYYNAESFNLKNYATQSSPDVQILPENFASQADYAKAAALAQLTGQDLTGLLNPANAEKAGTYSPDVVDFNKDAAMKYVSDTVRDEDKSLVQQAFGFDIDNPATYTDTINGGFKQQGYFDNVLNGRIIPYGDLNNPNAIRMIMGIQAAARQGIYKPILGSPDNPLLKPF